MYPIFIHWATFIAFCGAFGVRGTYDCIIPRGPPLSSCNSASVYGYELLVMVLLVGLINE